MNSKTKTPVKKHGARCQNCKSEFVIEPEDFEFYKKIDVPAPTFCPDCRAQRRFAFRSDRKLYKRKCDFSGKEIFSMFSSKDPIKVYDIDVWWSDKWDPMDYGQDYDFNESFLTQLKKLVGKVPFFSRSISDVVNSDYCNNAGFLKNCYLCFEAGFSEECAYNYALNNCKDCYDNYNIQKCELCYEGYSLIRCYRALFSSHCEDCRNIIFCDNCFDCSDCFGCTNLRHKKYHIFNEQYTKDEYFKKLKEFNLESYRNIVNLKKETGQRHLKFPNKFMDGRKNVNVTGEYIHNCKNVFNSYEVKYGEDSRYCQFLRYSPGPKDCYDYSWFDLNTRLVYEVVDSGRGLNNVKFCDNCFPDCRDLEYCFSCHSCSDCFGCVGLHHKKHCIFNKQYTKEEYHELVPKIKKHMDEMPYIDKKGNIYKYGEFFPIELSPCAYNNSVAQEYFPLTKEEIVAQNYQWQDKIKPEYKSTIKAADLSDNIKDTGDEILKEIIECENTNCRGSGVFKPIPTELEFYKKNNIPIPRLCPECRYQERIKQRNPMKLWERECMKKGCDVKFQTSYSPDRKEIVYCEKCYQKEIE